MSPHLNSKLLRVGKLFHNLAVKANLINIDLAIEQLQGHNLKGIYWDFKLARLDIFITESQIL